MRDILIGTITGVSAAIAMVFLAPKPLPAPPPILRDVMADYDRAFDVGYPQPATQPDPTRRKLEKMLDKVEVKGGRLDKVLDFLANSTGVNMAVNWRALEAAGIPADCAVTLNLHELPARVVLNEALRDAGGGNIKLGYRLMDGVVRVSTADDLAHDSFTRVYDIGDLIDQMRESSRNEAKNGGRELTEQEAMDVLVRTIQETIDPTVWRDAGGSIGAIRSLFHGKLIVTQTLEGHEDLRQLLAGLRQKQKDPHAH